MNRVQGLIGISSKMSNFNADFERMPRQTSNGEYFATDKSIKYLYRDAMDKDYNDLVLMKRSMKLVKDKDGNGLVIPRTLPEKYEYLFDISHKKDSMDNIMKNIFKCSDVRNFGATFAEANISLSGAVQFGMGFNVYEDTVLTELDITSPFRNSSSSSEFAAQTTLGKAIVTEEAHYIFPFSISPNAYKEFINAGILEEGYTEEDYKKFKEISLSCASRYKTGVKNNIGNELALFIEFNGNYIIQGLENKIAFKNTKNGISCDFSKLNDILNKMSDKIKNIELYIDNEVIELTGVDRIIKVMSITTKEEI